MAGSAQTRAPLVGRYRLEHVLGRGGSATVWRAHDERLARPVAVKEVRIPSGVDERTQQTVRSRYVREALVAARISHPAAVTVYDAFEEDDSLYLVMELVEA